MRALTLIGSGLMMCGPLWVLAASTSSVPGERSLREECSAFSQAGMLVCLAKKADESDRTLRQAENRVDGMLSQWDEDNQHIGLAKTRLAKSGKEFARYREAQCGFSASLTGGGAGNAHEMGRLACVTELNSRRAEQLRDAVVNLPIK